MRKTFQIPIHRKYHSNNENIVVLGTIGAFMFFNHFISENLFLGNSKCLFIFLQSLFFYTSSVFKIVSNFLKMLINGKI